MTIEVGSPIQGIVRAILVKRGDRVIEGQILAQLESDLEETALEMARTRFKYLNNQYNRLIVVQTKSLASDEIVDRAKSEMETARLEVKRREIILEQKSIRSRVDAVVVARLLSPGEFVYEQTPVLQIAKTDILNVEVIVPTSMFGKITEGASVKIRPEAPLTGTFDAVVDVVDKIMDAASSTFGVRLLLPNPDLKIPAGLRCTAEFILE